MSVFNLDGPLHAEEGAALRRDVKTQLQRGARTIVLSLAGVTDVDAAGTGELVRAYKLVAAATGTLRIMQVPPRVREVLDRVGLFRLLSGA